MKIMIKILTTLLVLTGLTTAQANVQYRITYETSANQYAVYMTPDSLPTPDLALTAQVTVKVPHDNNSGGFFIRNIQSHIQGASWHLHSQVHGPSENPQATYLSFGMLVTGTTTPTFNWEPGIEKKIFTFQSMAGCRHGVALLENTDPFAQLPNSQNTNPGNQFTNLGWASANNYTGNYGKAVDCLAEAPAPESCVVDVRKQTIIERRTDILETALTRLEQRRKRLTARLDKLKQRKEALINHCL